MRNSIHLIILFLFISTPFVGMAQSSPKDLNGKVNFEKLVKDLRLITKEEEKTIPNAYEFRNAILFSQDYKKIPISDLGRLMASPDQTMDLYLDKKDETRVVRVRPATDNEKAVMKANMVKLMREGKVSFGQESELVGKKIMPFKLKDINGKVVDSKKLKGKVVVFNFWFIGCKPCVEEIPELNELVSRYTAEDIVFLAVALDKKSKLKRFLKAQPYDYNIVPDERKFAKSNDVAMYPTHMIVDADGVISYVKSGFGDFTIPMLENGIKSSLEK